MRSNVDDVDMDLEEQDDNFSVVVYDTSGDSSILHHHNADVNAAAGGTKNRSKLGKSIRSFMSLRLSPSKRGGSASSCMKDDDEGHQKIDTSGKVWKGLFKSGNKSATLSRLPQL